MLWNLISHTTVKSIYPKLTNDDIDTLSSMWYLSQDYKDCNDSYIDEGIEPTRETVTDEFITYILSRQF